MWWDHQTPSRTHEMFFFSSNRCIGRFCCQCDVLFATKLVSLSATNNPPMIPVRPNRIRTILFKFELKLTNLLTKKRVIGHRHPKIIASVSLNADQYGISTSKTSKLILRRTLNRKTIKTLWFTRICYRILRLVDVGISHVLHFEFWIFSSNKFKFIPFL